MNTENQQHTNRLIDERSPYLLQHAHNPVDWYPWGDEAFGKAKAENKLIFLSIGYSTCHWCHVMEKESFEDQMVADLMNRVFVSIKVDREERPDLDNVFMEIAMMMNRRGGWPLNLILTPEGRPFYAATYIPRGGSAGRTGMLELIPQVETVWNERPEEVRASADEILRALKDSSREAGINTFVDSSAPALNQIKSAAFAALKNSYDSDSGGFNRQPKFPQPQNLLFLLRYYLSAGSAEALDMAVTTLDHMAAGGIYDRLGYGFHRYSTDKEWRLPHFEKMLYDQAMIILAYTEAWQITGKPSFRRTAEEVITYVLRDMRSPEGGFYSAEDADSEGVEGKFYLWDYDELIALLEEAGYESSRWADYFSLHPRGNFADEATKLKTGENILFTDPDDNSGLPGEYEAVRSLLFSEREKRVHPHKDDKILTDWNGLMIFALAKAAGAFGEPKYYEAAVSAANFITAEMVQSGGALLHSYRLGESGTLGMIDDYAFLTRGLLELYRAGFDQSFIEQAILITGYARAHFEDVDHGGYFQSDSLQTDLLIRKKALIDNAVPAGNSLMYENLMQLFKITGETAYRDSADGILATLGDELRSYPSAFAMLLSSFDYSGTAGREIVIAGESAEAAADMLEIINGRFLPGTVVVLKTTETAEALAGLAPYTAYYSLPEGRKAAVYVCTDFTCSSPVYTAEGLRALLEE